MSIANKEKDKEPELGLCDNCGKMTSNRAIKTFENEQGYLVSIKVYLCGYCQDLMTM